MHAAEGGGVDVVETPFDVKKEDGDLPLGNLEGLHLMCEGGDWVRGREAGQRAALVGVEEARCPGHTGKSTVHYPREDLGESLEQNNHPEG